MKKVHVNLAERSYDIVIGNDTDPSEWGLGSSGGRALVVSDTNVAGLYADRFKACLANLGFEVSDAVIPAGETSKNIEQFGWLCGKAADAGLDRKSVIVALGGGVVGDLAGFAAASYLRGIRFLQIPTSLLAMVDSSVGGKTGVNLPGGKNLVGAFHQPSGVVVMPDVLTTLPEREYVSGLAEVVKYGIIWDAVFLESIDSLADDILKRDGATLAGIIARCCEIKAEIVGTDERESGVRAILNFGHTLGHALENIIGYGAMLHGEAVAIGMCFALRLSEQARGLDKSQSERMINLMKRLGLPSSIPPGVGPLEWQACRKAMNSDKKAVAGKLRFVLIERPGASSYGCSISDDLLKETFYAIR